MCQCRETFDASGPLLSSASFVSSFAEPEDNLHHGALEVYKLEAAKCPGADEPLCDKVRECVDRAAMRVLGASILAKDSIWSAAGVFDLSRSRWYGLASSTCIARHPCNRASPLEMDQRRLLLSEGSAWKMLPALSVC
ncbi:unnamed protein product [Durusdinium trenchii]|uniref:Uncharacterized protein n=1 Tax=Durusdinium trenchii TaxID=1381693 RepID=A0ABP0QFS6_9DINO